MKKYDVFRFTEDGSPLWVEDTQDLVVAKAEAARLAQNTGGHYFVVDLLSQKMLYRTTESIVVPNVTVQLVADSNSM